MTFCVARMNVRVDTDRQICEWWCDCSSRRRVSRTSKYMCLCCPSTRIWINFAVIHIENIQIVLFWHIRLFYYTQFFYLRATLFIRVIACQLFLGFTLNVLLHNRSMSVRCPVVSSFFLIKTIKSSFNTPSYRTIFIQWLTARFLFSLLILTLL